MTDGSAARNGVSSNGAIGLVVLYRWRLHPGCEDVFVAAWQGITRALLEHGSFGSRLHSGDDGWWYGYAQWPDDATRKRAFNADAFAAGAEHAALLHRMRACIAESAAEVDLTPVADWLRLPHNPAL